MMNKKTFLRSSLTVFVLLLISVVGFTDVRGYGGGGSYLPTDGGYIYNAGQYISINPATTTEVTLTTDKEYQNWFVGNVKGTDFIQDGKVDLLDFNKVMVDWGKKGFNISTDANKNGEVDILDFNLLMVYWGNIKK